MSARNKLNVIYLSFDILSLDVHKLNIMMIALESNRNPERREVAMERK